MKRIAFTTLLALALIASACHKNSNKQTPTSTPASSGTVKPEIDTGHEVSIASPTPTPMEMTVAEIDLGGTPHDPECTEDHIGLAQGLMESKQIDAAIAELEKGVYDEPESFDIRKALGQAYRVKGDLDRAAGHFRAATDEVDDAGTWMELAQVEFDIGDFDQSARAAAKVAKLDPSSPDPWRLLARVQISKEMWKESIDASEEAIARGSDSPWTFNNLGYAYLVLGKADDAVRELEKAVSFDTGVTPAIWNNLGLAYEKKGSLPDAASAYRAALAGNPQYVKAKVNLKRITEVAKADGIAIGAKKAELEKDVSEKVAPTPSPE